MRFRTVKGQKEVTIKSRIVINSDCGKFLLFYNLYASRNFLQCSTYQSDGKLNGFDQLDHKLLRESKAKFILHCNGKFIGGFSIVNTGVHGERRCLHDPVETRLPGNNYVAKGDANSNWSLDKFIDEATKRIEKIFAIVIPRDQNSINDLMTDPNAMIKKLQKK